MCVHSNESSKVPSNGFVRVVAEQTSDVFEIFCHLFRPEKHATESRVKRENKVPSLASV